MYSFELSPNCSLTRRQAIIFFSSIAAVSLVIAGTFAVAGLWPVLPFAGLELAILGWALLTVQRRSRRREYIEVDEARVVVRKVNGHKQWRCEFARPWTRVALEPAAASHWPSRLTLSSGGRRVEVGEFLTDTDRESLKQRLATLVARTPWRDDEDN